MAQVRLGLGQLVALLIKHRQLAVEIIKDKVPAVKPCTADIRTADLYLFVNNFNGF